MQSVALFVLFSTLLLFSCGSTLGETNSSSPSSSPSVSVSPSVSLSPAPPATPPVWPTAAHDSRNTFYSADTKGLHSPGSVNRSASSFDMDFKLPSVNNSGNVNPGSIPILGANNTIIIVSAAARSLVSYSLSSNEAMHSVIIPDSDECFDPMNSRVLISASPSTGNIIFLACTANSTLGIFTFQVIEGMVSYLTSSRTVFSSSLMGSGLTAISDTDALVNYYNESLGVYQTRWITSTNITINTSVISNLTGWLPAYDESSGVAYAGSNAMITAVSLSGMTPKTVWEFNVREVDVKNVSMVEADVSSNIAVDMYGDLFFRVTATNMEKNMTLMSLVMKVLSNGTLEWYAPLNAEDGEVVGDNWFFESEEVIRKYSMDRGNMDFLAIDDDRDQVLAMTTNSTAVMIYCLNSTSGEGLYTIKGDPSFNGPITVDYFGNIYVPSTQKAAFAVMNRMTAGSVVSMGEAPLSYSMVNPVVLGNSTVYLATSQSVYSYLPSTGGGSSSYENAKWSVGWYVAVGVAVALLALVALSALVLLVVYFIKKSRGRSGYVPINK